MDKIDKAVNQLLGEEAEDKEQAYVKILKAITRVLGSKKMDKKSLQPIIDLAQDEIGTGDFEAAVMELISDLEDGNEEGVKEELSFMAEYAMKALDPSLSGMLDTDKDGIQKFLNKLGD